MKKFCDAYPDKKGLPGMIRRKLILANEIKIPNFKITIEILEKNK